MSIFDKRLKEFDSIVDGEKPKRRWRDSYPRTRTNNALSSINGEVWVTNKNCSQPYAALDGTFTCARVGQKSVISDWVVPGFSVRSKRNEIFNNDLVIQRESHAVAGDCHAIIGIGTNKSCTSPTLYTTRDYRGSLNHWWFSGAPSGGSILVRNNLLAESDIDAASIVASTQAWAKTASHSASILTDLAEMRQTLDMFRHPINAAHKVFDGILRRNNTRKRPKAGTRDYIDYVQGQWLQYRYGVRPLISSVHGIVDAVKKQHPQERFTSRSSYRVSANSSTGLVPYDDGICMHSYKYQYTDEVTFRAGILMEESVNIAEALGIDASGLLGLPWELTPFSFVFDWMNNFGSWLQGSYLHIVKRPLSDWLTRDRVRTTVFTMTGTTSKTPTTWQVLRGTTEARTSLFVDKDRIANCPGPAITWKPQALSGVISDLRLVDSFALLNQKFKNIFL